MISFESWTLSLSMHIANINATFTLLETLEIKFDCFTKPRVEVKIGNIMMSADTTASFLILVDFSKNKHFNKKRLSKQNISLGRRASVRYNYIDIWRSICSLILFSRVAKYVAEMCFIFIVVEAPLSNDQNVLNRFH